MTTLTIFYGSAKPIKAIGVNQCRLLEFAYDNRGWHTAKQDRATLRAVSALARKGYLEVSGDQFKFTYPKGYREAKGIVAVNRSSNHGN